MRHSAPRSPPKAPSGFRPPTGPGSSRTYSTPARSPTVPTSTLSRVENPSPSAPPAGPRGYDPSSRGAYRGRGGRGEYRGDYGRGGYGRGSFGGERGSRPEWGAAPPNRWEAEVPRGTTPITSRPTPSPVPSVPVTPSDPSPSTPVAPTGPASSIPTGPRVSVPTRPYVQHSSSIYGGRTQSISTAASGPRPHPAMANLPHIIPGGKIDPTASGLKPDAAIKQKRLEEQAEVLRDDLHAKQDKLRKNLREYEEIKRTAASWALRSELSERHVRQLAGEGLGGAAF